MGAGGVWPDRVTFANTERERSDRYGSAVKAARTLVLASLITLAGCVALPTNPASIPATASSEPSPVTSQTLSQPSPVASITPTPSQSTLTAPPTSRWHVDVINGPRTVVVSLATDTSAGLWLVPAGASLTLLDEPEARPGGVYILEEDCTHLAYSLFDAESFTLVLSGPATGPGYTLTIETGAPLLGPPSTDFFPYCSG